MFHRFSHPLRNIRERSGNPHPGIQHGNADRVMDKFIHGGFEGFNKYFHGFNLRMPVIHQAV